MVKTQDEILSNYKLEIEVISIKIDKIKKQIDKLSFLRIGLFLIEILFFVLFVRSADDVWRLIIGLTLLIPILIFALVVKKQSLLDKEVLYLNQLYWVNQNEINLMLDLANGYDDGTEFASETHPFTADLDIFGPSSLFDQLNRCITKNGLKLLASHLAEPLSINEIIERQAAIKEVLSKIEETYAFRANLKGYESNQIEKIKKQLNSLLGEQLLFIQNKFLRIYTATVPYISLSLILSGLILDQTFWSVFALYLIINVGLNVFLNAKVNKVFYGFSGGSNLLNDYATAIKWTEKANWQSAYIKSLFKVDIPVSEALKTLSTIIKNFDARLNILVGGILNALLLWDFRCCIKLDTWYKASSSNVIDALNRLGDFEEIISIATTAYNEPRWNFPQLETGFLISAENLGHPLINKNNRVVNDFNLEKHPTVDIVTGSNMAGKSTFLRTLGINLVLAYIGAPVCASKMKLSIFKILTYMRIKDSLNESTSTFKAELIRLKMILDNVAEHKNALVLIDEMLRGTNSRDKYLGSKVFIEKLIATKTPALFATHDLQLSELIETNPLAVRNFHFDIQITEGEMKFDYKLKHGACKTFNADILLKEIGLSLD